MITPSLNLSGQTLVSVVMFRESEEKSAEFYKEVAGKITNDYFPELTGFIEKQGIMEMVHKSETIEDLEKIKYNLIPDDFFTVVAGKLDADDRLKDTERMFLLSQISDRIIFSIKQYVNNIMHQRASVIAKTKKSNLILP